MTAAALALLAAATLAAAPAAPRRVAVLDFAASWTAECAAGGKLTQAQREQCEMLTLFADQARGGALAVLRPPAFVVMTRENTAQILKDMGGQCTEGECEVETARLLGASVVLSGQVNFMEGTWLVSIKVHDVATAALLGTGDTEGKSKLEAFRAVRAETEKMLKAAAGLDGTGAAPSAAAPTPEPMGTLALVLDEEGAKVTLDGQPLATGPVDKTFEVKAGAHRLAVAKDGFEPFEEALTIEPGKKAKSKPKLKALPKKVDPVGVLALDVADEGAQVLVDGKEVGTGPLEKELTLPEGTHQLVVMKQGFFTLQEAVKIEIGGKVKAKPRLVAVPVAAATGGQAAPVTEEARPSGFRKWWVEARGSLTAPVGHTEFKPSGIDPAYLLGFELAVGFRLDRIWSFSLLASAFPGNSRTSSVAGGTVEGTLTQGRVALAAAWSPRANPHLSLAATLGWANTEARVSVSGGEDDRQNVRGLVPGLEARFDLPLGQAWFVGARAGLWATTATLRAQASNGTASVSYGGNPAFVGASAAVGYRF